MPPRSRRLLGRQHEGEELPAPEETEQPETGEAEQSESEDEEQAIIVNDPDFEYEPEVDVNAAFFMRAEEMARKSLDALHEHEPSEAVIVASLEQRRKDIFKRRGDNGTVKAYSQWQKEWKARCAASAGDVVYGLQMQEWKEPRNEIPTPAKAAIFIHSYAAQRPQRRSNGSLLTKRMGLSGVKQSAKALSDLYKDFKASKSPAVREAMKKILPPRETAASSRTRSWKSGTSSRAVSKRTTWIELRADAAETPRPYSTRSSAGSASTLTPLNQREMR